GETFFSVTLKFGGSPKRLSVPYAAVTRFYDPSVQFALQFEAPDIVPPEPTVEPEPEPAAETSGDDAPKIISLDQFRKK
ncbi:MAG: ClpXP protease specificity-enhancing factor SspB, partial [bacterium]|nr:ClpXP protease specificity-enhancing factor SspB [bacterium]